MPHRFAEHFTYYVLVGAGMSVSFAAAVAQTVQGTAKHAILAVGDLEIPASSPALYGWAAFLGTVLTVLINAFINWRRANTLQDQADAESWGDKLGNAQVEIRRLKADLEDQYEDHEATKRQLREAQAQLASVNDQLRENRHGLRNVAQTASNAAQLATIAVGKAEAIEQNQGSTSALNIIIPAPPDPKAEPKPKP